MQIQDVAGLLWDSIMSTMVALASVTQKLHLSAMDLGPEMASEVILAIEELYCMASTRLGHALCPGGKLFQ